MVDMTNVGAQQYANRGFIPLAIEAGIEAVIVAQVPLARDEIELLLLVKEDIEATNGPLSAALNTQTLRAILNYIETKGNAPVLAVPALPELLDEDGPAGTWASDAGSGTIAVTFSEKSGWTDGYEIYVDGLYAKHGDVAASGGTHSDSVSVYAAGDHTVRVLFNNADGDQTRFGPVAEVTLA